MMVQRLICCLSVLCLSVSVVNASDQQGKSSPLPSPIADHSSRPAATARIPEVEEKLTPVEHLRRAAEHLDAAAVGENADTLHQQADELRDAANQLASQLAARLDELRQQAAAIQKQIQEQEGTQPAQEQLEIEFRVVELDLARLEQLGFQMDFIRSDGQTKVVQADAISNKSGTLDTIPSEALNGFIDSLISEGTAQGLSKLTLKVNSGRPATCHSGGEFPVPASNGNGEPKIELRSFGTRIEVLAELLENGAIRLDCASEYSRRDFTNAVTIGEMVVPGITTTRFNTQVEMEFGRTLLISGQSLPDFLETVQQTQSLSASNEAKGKGPSSQKRIIVLATPRRVAKEQD